MLSELLAISFLFTVLLITGYLVRHYLFTVTVLSYVRKQKPHTYQSHSTFEPFVSVLIPAHNEEHVIGPLLEKISQTIYPKDKLEVITIVDASTDQTGTIADSYAKKNPQIKVLHRGPDIGGRGKPAALNDALQKTKGEIIICFDADYIPHPDLVRKLVEKFEDPCVGAVQGRPVVINEPENMVTRLNALERIGGYKVDQQARDLLGLIPQFGGTVGGFRRSVIMELGGFDESMITEDTDLTFEIVLAGYKIHYADDAECYEEAVASWPAYWRQRHRWAKGHMQVCLKHAFRVVRSRRLAFRQKLDGLLLLHVYFMPLVTLLSLFVGAYLILTGYTAVDLLWLVVPTSLYSFVGNFAPFFEIGVGAYLDGRSQAQWLMPLLILLFFVNMLICAKAFLGLIYDKALGRRSAWAKTEHWGKTTCYVHN